MKLPKSLVLGVKPNHWKALGWAFLCAKAATAFSVS